MIKGNRLMSRRSFLAAGVGAAAVGALALWESKRHHLFYQKPVNQWTPRSLPEAPDIELRRHPYPYRASMSITSDIDGSSPKEFGMIHQFLNTDRETETGKGLGLDVGNSCWMVVDSDWPGTIDREGKTIRQQMSYWSSIAMKEEYAALLIRKYTRCGWIDSVHSYGDFNRNDPGPTSFTRAIAERSITEWKRRGLQYTVWIDHGNSSNVQNLGHKGSPRTYQGGDDPSSPYYHTDLLIPYGIRFVWHSASSADEVDFSRSDLIYPIVLGDGQKVWGFHRYSCAKHWFPKNPDFLWSPYLLQRQVTEDNLSRLIEHGGFCSLAQHLGGPIDLYLAFPEEALGPLRRISELFHQGTLLVARTSRLLRYNQVNNFLRFQVQADSEGQSIILGTVDDPHLGSFKPSFDDLRGTTFYCNDPSTVRLFYGDRQIPDQFITRNPADHTGRPSISLRWYEPDYSDYYEYGQGLAY
ncbi:hypothetical protein [Heliobacterium mobile]|nr:hypothetical protein [Heliobacterium mobile]